MQYKRKILQIGIDGATWRVINPLIEQGRLPNLARLAAGGASGVLHSSEYSASPVVWTTMATGKEPAKHGIEDFFTPQRKLKARRIWEIFAERGETVGVYQHLVTWPPKPLTGFVVPAWLAMDDETHPRELQFVKALRRAEKRGANNWRKDVQHARQALSHGVHLRTLLRALVYRLARRPGWSELDTRYRGHLVDIDLHTDLFCYLLRKYRPAYATTVYYHADAAGHFYWKYMEPDLFAHVPPGEVERYGGVIPQVYQAIDAAVGRILRAAGDEYTVLVVSDHGMQPAVHSSGYLYRPKLTRVLEEKGYATDQGHALIGLDFYLNLLDQPAYYRSGEALLRMLNGAIIADTGEPVFEARRLLEHYITVRVKAARPELKTVTVQLPTGECYRYAELVSTSEKTSGTHHPEGILIMAGPGIRAGATLEDARLTDIVPTVLALRGMLVARDMDGRVLTGAFDEAIRGRLVEYVETYESETAAVVVDDSGLSDEERSLLEERLRALGYIE